MPFSDSTFGIDINDEVADINSLVGIYDYWMRQGLSSPSSSIMFDYISLSIFSSMLSSSRKAPKSLRPGNKMDVGESSELSSLDRPLMCFYTLEIF